MDDELYHYGIKGMKWGVRRYQNKDGTLTAAGKKRKRAKSEINSWSDDAKEAYRIKQKSVHEMSNKELQTLNKRMNLESEYRRLNPTNIQKGLGYVKTVAGAMGTVVSLTNNSSALIKIGQKVLAR